MLYYKLKVSVELNTIINYQDLSTIIGHSIQKSMYNQDELKQLHDKKNYKYIYSPFFPFANVKQYNKGEKYYFFIHSFDEKVMVKFNYALNNYQDKFISVINTKLSEINLDNVVIDELTAITPVIVTIDGMPWLSSNYSLDILIQKLYDNLEKKYFEFFKEDWDKKEDFIKYSLFENISLIKDKPISRQYKDIKLLGYKFKIKVGTNPIAQKLAKVAIVQGLGEKNSILGSGYVNFSVIGGKRC